MRCLVDWYNSDNETHSLVKIALYDDVTFALISAYYLDEEGEAKDILIGFVLGDDFLLSFNESDIPLFDGVEKAILDNILPLRKKSADFLFYILMNEVNSFNNNFIVRSEDRLWLIEDMLVAQQETDDVIHILRGQRKTFIYFKRLISALREEFEDLLENSNRKIKEENLVYFENLDDKFRTISHNIDNYDEAVKFLLDLHYNNNSTRMNEIMKRLSLVATIFIPLTFLVGVWGMNFSNMPELTWKYGYLMAWIVFLVVVLIVIELMKKKKWF